VPDEAVFVGDDERDIAAGRAAGTRTVAALWGYIQDPDRVHAWGADWTAESPDQLLRLLRLESPRAAV
jgi:phosphoglycolate phosphatase